MLSHSITHAATVLQAGGVIAHYTDTVTGLACLPKERLLQRLASIKHRSKEKGFILLATTLQQLQRFVHCSSTELAAIDTTRPESTTWLVKASEHVPPALMGVNDKLAIRLSKHANIKYLCNCVGPIASTSANLSGQAICSELHGVRKVFGPQIDYVHLTEGKGTEKASTIIDMESGTIIR